MFCKSWPTQGGIDSNGIGNGMAPTGGKKTTLEGCWFHYPSPCPMPRGRFLGDTSNTPRLLCDRTSQSPHHLSVLFVTALVCLCKRHF